VARVLPIVVVLALLGCTAAAFAVTEGLKLEHSPVSNTHVGKTVAPDSLANKTVPIGFQLRKPDRVTVELVNGNGDVVRTLARSRREPSGALQFNWNGRGDNREVVPDGVYRPRVHLANAHKTIVLPNPITFKVNAPSDYVYKRRDWILSQMRGLGGSRYLKELENPTAPPKASARKGGRK